MKSFCFDKFDAIFQQHTKPLIDSYLSGDNEARSLLYTIEPGKNRFRSGLSYLLSNETEVGIFIGAASEIAWAAILILDDIGDNTFIRRGKISAWQKFGLLESSHAASMGFIIAKHILEEAHNFDLSKSLEKNIELTLRAQIEQSSFSISVSPTVILDNYIKKTALGRWPIEAAIMSNIIIDKEAREKIIRFSEIIAKGAQIRNDLDDLMIDSICESYEPAMKDLQDRMVNYPLALFFEIASTPDKTEFLSKYWGQPITHKKQVMQDVYDVLIKYDIFNQCEDKIDEQFIHALNLIESISFPQKDLIINWAMDYKKKG